MQDRCGGEPLPEDDAPLEAVSDPKLFMEVPPPPGSSAAAMQPRGGRSPQASPNYTGDSMGVGPFVDRDHRSENGRNFSDAIGGREHRRPFRGPRERSDLLFDDRNDRYRRRPLEQNERISKALSAILRHRGADGPCGIQVRRDGFAKWEDVLGDPSVRRYPPSVIVDAIDWSKDRNGQRRFEMAQNVDANSGVWVRALGKHTAGEVDLSLLPPGVTNANRDQADREAQEVARGYTVQDINRNENPERRSAFGTLDRRQVNLSNWSGPAPPQPTALKDDGSCPPPPQSCNRLSSDSTALPESEDDYEDLPPPPPPPSHETSRGNQVITGSMSSASSSEVQSPKSEAQIETTLQDPKASENALWPPKNSMGCGAAVQAFDGAKWSRENPSNDVYLSFLEGQEVAAIDEAVGGWRLGILKGTSQPGWYPAKFVTIQ
eukprot:TRINITY_DN30574_c0_g2_i1.p1 TRINITY_DN30574_c0_g2~~TRINITY_DN30574_c0_g2_i1.p1  ORF type:complete len:434 (-),score=68.64 TRINITY_DN30574_c0_g2_i1:185-1486(-)